MWGHRQEPPSPVCELPFGVKCWKPYNTDHKPFFYAHRTKEFFFLRIVIVFQAYFSTIAIFCSSLEECELRYFSGQLYLPENISLYFLVTFFFGDKSHPERKRVLSWTQTLHMNIIFLEIERLDGQNECHCHGIKWQSYALIRLFCYMRMTGAGQAVISGATCWTEEAQPPPHPAAPSQGHSGWKGELENKHIG